ncbi:TonB-dependent receptor [Chitinophaga sancti]|uniref:Iron complex outermembrane recepter protein n=1 Tax=Chitinophaga sancti TaxID=1004 RepID=A0A1K1QX81_9BACT|nr:TonB-dependent receptor [Chitinophaga sancti]WQD62018.1 TonB-dependent receptor [Chitinophaga sancti]WQG92413.1 TonB-dependent receptor [Chitinophaga sancti]SFW64227.1 iron complex outermembrane recepter protein [Chitinophaga sancti]
MKRHLLATVSVLLWTLFANAQDKDTITQKKLDEVVIYKANTITPVTYQNLNMKVIDQKNTGQEPAFLLSETPSITVYSDAGSYQGYSYYRMRGMDQTRINTTLDGMPLNEPEDQGAYFSNYPDILNSISNIQLQRGVGTSKNGAASYAGSVQLFSPDLKDSAKTTIGGGYGAYNSYRLFGEYQTGIKNHKAFYVRASQVATDGYKYHAANNSQSIFMSGGLFYDKSTWKLNLMAGHQKNDMAWLGVADTLIAKDRRTNGNLPNEKDHFFQGLVQLQNIWQPTAHAAISSSVYYTYLKGGYGFDGNNYMGLPSEGYLFNYNFQSHFVGLFSNYTLSKDHYKWTTGIHGNLYNRRHAGTDNVVGELYRNKGYKNELSAFSKIEYYLNRFTLYADLQYRMTTFDYKGSVPFNEIHWQFLNPKAGVNFAVNHSTSLYYSIGRTGREPTRNDLFAGNDDLPANSTFHQQAESVVDQELGIRINKHAFNFQLNAYYMNFSNEIVLNGKIGPNGLLLTDNVKSSYRTGIELNAAYQCHAFRFSNNSSFNHSRIREESTTFSPILTPRFIINQEVGYQYKQLGLAVSGRYQDRSYLDFANTNTIGSYVLVNARAEYTLRGCTLSFFVNNITGAKYYNNGYVEADGTRKLFAQAPTNVYAAFKYSF